MEAFRTALNTQRKNIDTMEEQIMLLQRQLSRLNAQVYDLRGKGASA